MKMLNIIKWVKWLLSWDQKIRIVDVIHHRNKYETQVFYVLNRDPVFLYEKSSSWLRAEDNGLWSFYEKRGGDKTWKAFAGRKFSLNLTDGGTIECEGGYWDAVPPEYSDIFAGSYGTVDGLGKCNVFYSVYYDKSFQELIWKWLKKNKPSNNYHKYDKNSKAYMQHMIISRFKKIFKERR